ncbi:MAG: hypothetical protein RJQ04_01950 [Longimicrobiales bacterium]
MPLPARATTRSRRCGPAALALVLALGPGSAPWEAAAQTTPRHLQDALVPAGRLRLGFAPSFASWDSRWGRTTVDGAVRDADEPLGADLTDTTGRSLFPGIADLQAQLDDLTSGGGHEAVLGSVSGLVTKNVTRLDFSAHVGVFDWLTVGATLPWIKTRTAVQSAFRTVDGSNLGLNPLIDDNAAVSAWLAGVDAARAAAESRAASLCGSDPGEGCSAARALADRTGRFAAAGRRAYFASAFFLVAGSDAAQAVSDAAAALSGDLTDAGLPGVGTPLFAPAGLDEAGFYELPENGGAGIGTTPLGTVDGLWAAGDIEVTASARILAGEVRDSGAAVPRLAWRLVGGGLVRLGTGIRDDPDVLLDLGTGDGQTDLEGFLDAAVQIGSRLGLRGGLRYGVQRPVTMLRRVAPHERIFAPVALTRAVEWSPGSYLDLIVSPRFHLDETLSLSADYRLFDKSADAYALAFPAADGTDPDPTVLASETAMTVGELGVGLRYSTLAGWRTGRVSPPVEISARLVLPLHGAGGQTPRATRADVSIRLFRALWGR